MRTHFSDENYGLIDSKSSSQIRLKLRYIDSQEDVRIKTSSWSYHSEESRLTVFAIAKRERDRLLKLPEYQAYLATKYLVNAPFKSCVKPRSHPQRQGVITALPGLFVKVTKSHSVVIGGKVNYVNIIASGPDGEGGTKTRSLSVRKYGLATALREAAFWRNQYVGDTLPTEEELALGEQQVLDEYRDVIDALPKQKRR